MEVDKIFELMGKMKNEADKLESNVKKIEDEKLKAKIERNLYLVFSYFSDLIDEAC